MPKLWVIDEIPGRTTGEERAQLREVQPAPVAVIRFSGFWSESNYNEHLGKLPRQDRRSRAILEAMRVDEERHSEEAVEAGASPVPAPVRKLMAGVSRIMKFGAYRV